MAMHVFERKNGQQSLTAEELVVAEARLITHGLKHHNVPEVSHGVEVLLQMSMFFGDSIEAHTLWDLYKRAFIECDPTAEKQLHYESGRIRAQPSLVVYEGNDIKYDPNKLPEYPSS
tara:strand:- start:1717 stop:2067 length:351 start_codon:yes stop_codon:yes gene_type:complete